MPGRDRDAVELRAVAPLVIAETNRLVGAVTLISNGTRTIAVTSAEVLRPQHGANLAIAIKLDGSASVPVARWGMGRYSGIGLVELDVDVPAGGDVEPLPISAVCATVDPRGAPAAIVIIEPVGGAFIRTVIPVSVDAVTASSGMPDDVLTRLATPLDTAHAEAAIDGAPVFAWCPPDLALGRKREVIVFALAYPYRSHTFQPRDRAAVAELVGLEDLGRALIDHSEPDDRPELGEVAGEIGISSPIDAALDDLDRR